MKTLEDSAGSFTPAAPERQSRLFINEAFALFWTGQTVSTLGAQVTAFVVPLLAAITLHATSLQMGLLRAAEFAPFLVFTLPAGVWADYGIRRSLMIAANLIRGVFITAVPLAVFLGWMHLGVLYFVMFVMGSLKTVFEMAYQTYVPELVTRERLVNANSKIMMSYALGQSVGPGFGGIMVELLGAPMAVLTDATTYFLSAFCLFKIKHREVRTQGQRESIFRQIGGGFRFVAEQRHIRSLLWLVTANNFFQNAVIAILVLYATRDLGVRPGLFGITVSVGGLGAVMGAVGAEQLGRRFGPGPFVILSTTMVAIATLCFPLVHTGNFYGVVGLAVAYFVLSAGNSSITVFSWTIRQTLTPNSALGRMNGAFRFLVTGIMPFGALFGGWLGETIGIRSTLIVSGVALVLVAVSGRFTPLMKLKSLVVTDNTKTV
ncbi:MAG: MFS transporter [Verrucomicrobia bacterium]|nr:MFS transporter [Verrucomicrobiota bacterium]